MSVSGQLACGRLSTAKDGCRSCAESGASNAEGCATLQVCATLLRKTMVRVGTGADGGWGGSSQRECMRPQRLQKRQLVSRMSKPPGVQRRTTSVSGGRCTGKPRTTAQSRPYNFNFIINTERAMLHSTRIIQRSCESGRIRFRFSKPNQTLTTLVYTLVLERRGACAVQMCRPRNACSDPKLRALCFHVCVQTDGAESRVLPRT